MYPSKRNLLVLVVMASALFALWWHVYSSPPSGISERSYARIGNGMSMQEVEATIGGPCGNYGFPPHAKTFGRSRPGDALQIWNTPATSIWVFFDAAGRVKDKGIDVDTSLQARFISRLATFVGLN